VQRTTTSLLLCGSPTVGEILACKPPGPDKYPINVAWMDGKLLLEHLPSLPAYLHERWTAAHGAGYDASIWGSFVAKRVDRYGQLARLTLLNGLRDLLVASTRRTNETSPPAIHSTRALLTRAGHADAGRARLP